MVNRGNLVCPETLDRLEGKESMARRVSKGLKDPLEFRVTLACLVIRVTRVA